MSLSNDLLSQFAKLTNKKTKVTETTVYGVVKEYNNSLYVQLDGSELLTPVTTTSSYKAGDRVAVMIKNHTATVTGNLTFPSATTSDVKNVNDKIINVEKVYTQKLNAEKARIDDLEADNVTIHGTLTAQNGIIKTLEADNVIINGILTAQSGKIETLESDNLKINNSLEAANAIINNLDATYANIEELKAANANIENLRVDQGEFEILTADRFEAINATIDSLDTKYATIKDLDVMNATIDNLDTVYASISDLKATNANIANLNTVYANIDFSNIKMAAVKKIFSDSGIIKDLVVDNQTITGELIGVTLKGDLIEAGTIKADKLVVKGSDGIFYKLNVDAAGMSKEEAPTDSLHGSIITAKSIVAEKIAVEDLVSFGATIGGFHITNNSIYSGVKESVGNTTRGIYLDNDGQFGLGDSNNFVKFYKNEDGKYKLAICAESITFGSGQKSIENEIDTLKDEVTTNLRIESSRGTVFKNDSVSTVLSVVIYRGSQRITDMTALKATMGQNAYLQWKWQRLNEDSFGVISSDDARIGNEGFTFTLNPDDVDTKVTFICELIN